MWDGPVGIWLLCGQFRGISKIWNLAKEKLTTEEINNKLLFVTGSEGRTGWQLAAEWFKLETLENYGNWPKIN